VAQRLGREFVGLDLNPEYLELARKRIDAVPMGMGL
jgi:DNA modification methylase